MHNLEIREQEGRKILTGYVNIPEKFSKPLKDKEGKTFIETVETGVFAKAIENAKVENRNIPLMHKHKNIISENVEIIEDEIGVKFTAYDVNEDVFNEIREKGGKINCSFGFKAIRETVENVTLGMYKRVLNAIELLEITVTENPAYASSVAYAEVREGEDEMKLEELLKLREELDTKIAELTPEIDSVEEVELASDTEVKEDSAQEELAKQELEEEKSVAEQAEKVVDVIDSKLAVNQAELEFERQDLECIEKEVSLDRQKLERKQAEIQLMRMKLKMELDLLKLKG